MNRLKCNYLNCQKCFHRFPSGFFCRRKIIHITVIPYSAKLEQSDANLWTERSFESLECPETQWELRAALDARHISSDSDTTHLFI